MTVLAVTFKHGSQQDNAKNSVAGTQTRKHIGMVAVTMERRRDGLNM